MPEQKKPEAPEDESVDWKGATEFMNGRAQDQDNSDGDEGEPATFTPREFKYRGRTLTATTADEAAAIEDLIRESRGVNGRLGQENAELRERLARVEGRLESAPQEQAPELKPPSIELARTNPEAWYAEHLAYTAAMMQQQRMEIENTVRSELAAREATQQTENTQRAWGEAFYAANKHLDSPHLRPIVQDAYRRHAAEINAFGSDIVGAHERLAQLAEDAIAAIRTTGRETATTRPPQLESSTRRTAPQRREPERAPVTGASWLQKERARMRGESLNR